MIDHRDIIPLVPEEISGLSEQTSLSLADKEESYNIIKNYVNDVTDGILIPSENFKRDGCIFLGKLLDAESLKRELYQYPIYRGHIKNDLYSDSVPITDYQDSDLPGGIYCWSMRDLLRCKAISDVASSPLVIDFVSRYLGCLPTCYGINCMLSFGTSNHGTTARHRDLDDFKFLSLFIYLDDVDTTNGAHIYEKGTHLGNPLGERGNELPPTPHKQTVFSGLAGEAFVEDNWGVPRGMTLQPGKKRTCLWIRYGLYDNYTARHSVNLGENKAKEHFINMDNELNNYIFRFVAERG